VLEEGFCDALDLDEQFTKDKLLFIGSTESFGDDSIADEVDIDEDDDTAPYGGSGGGGGGGRGSADPAATVDQQVVFGPERPMLVAGGAAAEGAEAASSSQASPQTPQHMPLLFVEGAMTEAELTAISALKILLMNQGVTMADLHPHMRVAAESENYYLVRFLRARKCDPTDACEMVVANHR
jgi:hypothetical protein